jgi:uncharacterized membrane protein YfcA
MSPPEVLLLLVVGIAAGFLNTVAGGGSVITIPALTAMAGPAVANGTNRVAVLLQGVIAVAGFWRGGAMEWRIVLPLVPATVTGALGGAWVATLLSPGAIRRALAIAVALVAVSVLFKPSQWTRVSVPRLRQPWTAVVFFLVGFFGGFVQIGVGFFLLTALVLGVGTDLVRGNAAKNFLVLAYAPLVLLLFARASQVDWVAGTVLGLGTMVGAAVGAHLAVREGESVWIRWVIVVTAIASAVSTLVL